jgi:hypothetical protein
MEVEWSQSEEVTLPAPGASITILGTVGPLVQIKQFCDQIHDLLKQWV